MSVHLFGIRHHGVGSARSLLAALESLEPDCILIEGPPDADSLIPLVAHEQMEPPVALLVYDPEQPQRAVWYPLATFSPEWQAMRYGLQTGVAVCFMDLPQKHRLGLQAALEETATDEDPDPVTFSDEGETDEPDDETALMIDPLGALAAAAGESDGESWWGRVVEEADNPVEIFAAIHEAMTVLRAEHSTFYGLDAQMELLREAWMRTTIRATEKAFERIAVVCGAWHTPALVDRKSTKSPDKELLKGLPTVKTTATFAPWTYSRLALHSGYGAGIVSPGWYHHLWETVPADVSARWLAQVAALLRAEGLLASTAQVIDGVRLAEMLAALRGGRAGLSEMNEASIAVLCAGHTEPLNLIHKRLIVSERLGKVPVDTPAVPLRRDLSALQKKLRLPVSAEPTVLDLDLRQPTDLNRSQLFHRLNLLNIPWAQPHRGKTQGKGTFHEGWIITWTPELEVRLIESSIWGTTVETAALAFATHTAAQAQHLSTITVLLKQAILSALSAAVEAVVQHLYNLASITQDVTQLMAAAPPLVDTLRYGDVRQTDSTLIAPVLQSLVVRSCIGLYGACLNLDDDAAHTFYAHVINLHTALTLAQDNALLTRWYEALEPLTKNSTPHPLLSGTATRLLFRADRLDAEQVTQRVQRAFSVGHDSYYGANWLEGFLQGMEQTLVRDETLFGLIDTWVVAIPGEQFEEILPLLRRTFAQFGSPARRSLTERIKRGAHTIEVETLDEARAARVLPLLHQLLGIPT
jgi:hypothetical protein